jgi:hypothetical protein
MENQMRTAANIAFSIIATTILWSAAFAAPAATHNPSPATAPSTEVQPDCQKTGSDVSVLIDQRNNSANISLARAAFQVGIMECMEGDNPAANQHYQEAKNLLASDAEQGPSALPKH